MNRSMSSDGSRYIPDSCHTTSTTPWQGRWSCHITLTGPAGGDGQQTTLYRTPYGRLPVNGKQYTLG